MALPQGASPAGIDMKDGGFWLRVYAPRGTGACRGLVKLTSPGCREIERLLRCLQKQGWILLRI